MKTTAVILIVVIISAFVGCAEHTTEAIVAPAPTGSNTIAFETLVKNAGVVSYASDLYMKGTVAYTFSDIPSEVELEGPMADLDMHMKSELLFDNIQIPPCCLDCKTCDQVCGSFTSSGRISKTYALPTLGSDIGVKVDFLVRERKVTVLSAELARM